MHPDNSFGIKIQHMQHKSLSESSNTFLVIRSISSRVTTALLIILLIQPELQAQRRGGPVPVPQGGGGIFPEWLFYLIFGGIALFIAFAFLGWLGSRFRNFKSFTELLALLFGIGGTWIFWKEANWGFLWCLLAGFGVAVLVVSAIEHLYKQIKTR